MTKMHSFDVSVANEHGVDVAIMMGTIQFFCEYHENNNQHHYDGFYWMYNSAASWAEHFPYWSANKIQKLLKKMEELDLVVTGNFNKAKYDRTKWYRIKSNDEKIAEEVDADHSAKWLNGISQMDESNQPNGLIRFSQMAEPIPIQTNSNTIQTSTSEKKFSDDDLKLAEWIAEKVREVNSRAKPKLDKWADMIRLMRERDKLTHREIATVFQYANKDSFWRTNILSPSKLREKFGQLEAKMKQGQTHDQSASGHSVEQFGDQSQYPEDIRLCTSDSKAIRSFKLAYQQEFREAANSQVLENGNGDLPNEMGGYQWLEGK